MVVTALNAGCLPVCWPGLINMEMRTATRRDSRRRGEWLKLRPKGICSGGHPRQGSVTSAKYLLYSMANSRRPFLGGVLRPPQAQWASALLLWPLAGFVACYRLDGFLGPARCKVMNWWLAIVSPLSRDSGDAINVFGAMDVTGFHVPRGNGRGRLKQPPVDGMGLASRTVAQGVRPLTCPTTSTARARECDRIG
jgi:hypothetical protein